MGGSSLGEAAGRRGLAIAPRAKPGRRSLPLAAEARRADAVRPVYAVWELTLACDLACRHCGSRAGRARPDELTTAEALDLADQIAELGVAEVTLIGGEAYLRDDFFDVVRRLRGHGVDVTMTSGGRGLTPAIIERAAAAGLQGASISLDGDEPIHDRLRGVAGSYRAAIAAMRALRERNLRVACNTQINRLSMSALPGILETVAELGVHSWQIQITVPMGRAADAPEMLLQPYDLLELFPLLASLKSRCGELGVRMWPANNIGYFGPYESALRGHRLASHGGSCSAGRGSLGVEANGAIKGCPSLPSEAWTGGNVRDARLVDIWERAAPLRYTRDRTVETALWGFCRDCYYADECLAGCTWTSFVAFGRAGNNPYCHHRALEMQRQGRRERIVRREAAPGQPFDHGVFEIVSEPIPEEET
ncbi:MAG: radical SAM protein [Labilithrix sp.]|nr:radical SAM protein [Labilithrix sp.]MCW5812509.1 radical SAM protein [Labilithrix sp.]